MHNWPLTVMAAPLSGRAKHKGRMHPLCIVGEADKHEYGITGLSGLHQLWSCLLVRQTFITSRDSKSSRMTTVSDIFYNYSP